MEKNLKLKLFLLTFLYNSPLFSMDVPDPIKSNLSSKINASKALTKKSENTLEIEKLMQFQLKTEINYNDMVVKAEDLQKMIQQIKNSPSDQHIFILPANSGATDPEGEEAHHLVGIQISKNSKNQEECSIDYVDPGGREISQGIFSLFEKNFDIQKNSNQVFNTNNQKQFLDQDRDDQALFLTHLFKHLKKTKFLNENKSFPEIEDLSGFSGCLKEIFELELQIPDLACSTKEHCVANLYWIFGRLGQLYIKVGDATKDVSYYNEAALFCNYCISNLRTENVKTNEYLEGLDEIIKPYDQLNSIQRKLVNAIGGNEQKLEECALRDFAHHKQLEELRKYVKEKIKAIDRSETYIEDSKNLFHEITTEMKTYLANLYKDAEKVLGAPPCPCDYAIIGLGSMALQQMTPYSDLEFAILINNQKDEASYQEVKNYFKNLTQLVHFWVINLGESIIPPEQYNCDTRHLVRKAVNFDLGGKTPLGREDKPYELICTVDDMFGYMRNENQKSEHIDTTLPYILQKTCFIHGTQKLFDEYNGKTKEFLKIHGEARAVKMLWEGCCEIDYTNYSSKEYKLLGNIEQFEFYPYNASGRKFNVKQEIYRLPDRFIYNFGLIYGIDAKDNWETITKLADDEKISRDAEKNLKKALTFASLLRLKVYSHYDQHKEEIDWDEECSDLDQVQEEGLIRQNMVKTFQLNSEDLQENGAFFEYYYVTIPLTEKLKEFCLRGPQKKDCFLGEKFYDASAFVRADANLRLGRIGRTLEALQALTNEYKGDGSRLSVLYHRLGLAYMQSKHYEEAIKSFGQAQTTGASGTILCQICLDLGKSWEKKGDYKKAYKCFDTSLKTQEKLSESNPTKLLIETYNCLGTNLLRQSALEEGLTFLKKGLELSEQKKDAPLMAKCRNSYGRALQRGRQDEDALPYLKESLKMHKKIYSKNHPKIARIYHSIGEAYDAKNNYQLARKNYKKALEKENKNLDAAFICFRLADMDRKSRETYTKALGYYAKGVEILAGEDSCHPLTVAIYALIADLSETVDDEKAASTYYQKMWNVLEKKLNYYRRIPLITTCYQRSPILRIQKKDDEVIKNYMFEKNDIEDEDFGYSCFEFAYNYRIMEQIIKKWGGKRTDPGCQHRREETDDVTAEVIVNIASELDLISQLALKSEYKKIKKKIENICQKYEKNKNKQEIVKMLCCEAICLGVSRQPAYNILPLNVVNKIAERHPEYFVEKQTLRQLKSSFPSDLRYWKAYFPALNTTNFLRE